MNLDFEDGSNLIVEASEKVQENKAWQMWISLYPNMHTEGNKFIPFSEFYKQQTIPSIPAKKRTQEELAKEAEQIRKRFSGG